MRWRHVVSPNCRWTSSASSSDFVAVLPPAPQVTFTKKGRRARDMRSRRAWRLVKPYFRRISRFGANLCARVPAWTYCRGLWWEEFQGEVGAILWQGSELIRDLLHSWVVWNGDRSLNGRTCFVAKQKLCIVTVFDSGAEKSLRGTENIWCGYKYIILQYYHRTPYCSSAMLGFVVLMRRLWNQKGSCIYNPSYIKPETPCLRNFASLQMLIIINPDRKAYINPFQHI